MHRFQQGAGDHGHRSSLAWRSEGVPFGSRAGRALALLLALLGAPVGATGAPSPLAAGPSAASSGACPVVGGAIRVVAGSGPRSGGAPSHSARRAAGQDPVEAEATEPPASERARRALEFRREAEAAWSAGERLVAIERWQQELAADPEASERRLELAARQMEVHLYRGALETLAPVSETAPARRLAARAHLALCEYEAALTRLEREGEDGLLRLVCLERLGRIEAADEWAGALAQGPPPHDARLVRYLAAQLAREGRAAEAIDVWRALHARDPFDAATLFALGRALVRAGERDEGLALLQRHRELAPLLDELDFAERGVDLAPLHAPNHARVGDIERRIGRIERAEAAYARALALAEPDELVAIALRVARSRVEDRDRLDLALEVLASSARRVPDARLHVRAGDLLLAAGRASEARAAYERARTLRPGDSAIAERLRRAVEAGG